MRHWLRPINGHWVSLVVHHVFHSPNSSFSQLETGRTCFPSLPFSLQIFFQAVQKMGFSNVILCILVKITSSINPEFQKIKDKSMVKIDAFFIILSCIHWDCLGLTKAREHLLHCTERRELATQRLRRANPPAPTSYATTALYGSKPSGTKHHARPCRSQTSWRRSQAGGTRILSETHHSITEQNWLPAGFQGELALSPFSWAIFWFHCWDLCPSFWASSSVHSTWLIQWNNKLLGEKPNISIPTAQNTKIK